MLKETINTAKKIINKGVGHRKRLRERFLNAGLDGFLNYEIIELLLTLGTPRKDCKLIAKEAILKFNGLVGVLDASIESLQKINGIGSSNAFGIKLFQAISERYAKENVQPKIMFDSPELIFQFLRKKYGKKKKEYFLILCLDTKNKLIIDEVSVGILNASLVHPREIFSVAIQNSAAHIVIAHNHPSGDCTPSEEDIMTTRRLVEAGKLLGISIADHIIFSSEGYSSCAELKLF